MIIGSLFRCPENSELISDGTDSLDKVPELETEILQTLSELIEMLCWCKSYSNDRVG